MTVSIIEKVLGNNKFYTDNYIKETIALVKSITVKNDKEADLYNDYLQLLDPTFKPEVDKRDWRYYRHITGQKHPLDRDIQIASVDNGEVFVLDKQSLLIHKRSKQELLKFGLYYEEVVKSYPELELYIKAVITDQVFSDIQEIIDAPNFTIVSYNKELVEETEHDLMVDLQHRIDNYKNIWLIGYYSMVDNLFLASQYHIFYNYLVTSVLSLRLANAKTNNAHSYHIRLYLASHHYLDDALPFLTKDQQLFLYRNMLYLNNHAGSNFTFQTLIDKLFSDRNISVVNYIYQQKNTTNNEGLMNYTFKQKLLNTKNLVFNQADLSLESVASRERSLAPSNSVTYDYNLKAIDFKHRNALFSQLLTKDLETILLDETDSVRYKLLEILVDYWARLLAEKRTNFLVDLPDPATSMTTRLDAHDLFKLYMVVLYASQGQRLEEFPRYRIRRVFKNVLPTVEELKRICYKAPPEMIAEITALLEAIPAYHYYLTSAQFEQFVTHVYKLNIAIWMMVTNYSDMDNEGQMSAVVSSLHTSGWFEFDLAESVQGFFDRTGLSDPREYDPAQLEIYLFSILDHVYDKKLSFISRHQKLQDALTRVFFKFNSYTVQLINNYYGDSPLLVGPKDTRYSHEGTSAYDLSMSSSDESTLGFNLVSDWSYCTLDKSDIDPTSNYEHECKVHIQIDVDGVVGLDIEQAYETQQEIPLQQSLITQTQSFSKEAKHLEWMSAAKFLSSEVVSSESNNFMESGSRFKARTILYEDTRRAMPINVGIFSENSSWIQTQSSDDDLMFLALHM